MSAARTNLELYTRLNTELVSMIDHFTNLVKATKEGLEADEAPVRPDAAAGPAAGAARERRVPGELLEVSVEKLLAAGHQCVHTVSELKKGAILSDMDALLANVNALNASLAEDTHNIEQSLSGIRREAEGLLARMEAHFYTSSSLLANNSSGAGCNGAKGSEGGAAAAPSSPHQQGPNPAAATLAELCSQALQLIDDARGQPPR